MGLGKKKPTIGEVLDQTIDRARETAEHYVEVARPHVGAALDSAKEFVQDTAVPAMHDARDKAAPVIADARDKAAPVVAAGAAEVAAKATQAKDYATTKAAEVTPGHTPKKRSKVKVLLLAAGAAGAVAVVAKKLQGSDHDGAWQSSYSPTPPPSADPADTAAAAGTAGPTLTDVSDGGPDEVVDETLGAVDEPLPADSPDPLTDPLPEQNRSV